MIWNRKYLYPRWVRAILGGKRHYDINYEKLINCNLFKGLKLGIDPRLFTYHQIRKVFLKHSKIKYQNKLNMRFGIVEPGSLNPELGIQLPLRYVTTQ